MKKFQMRWVASVVIVAGTIGFLAGQAFTEDPAMDPEAMMKMMAEMARPGTQHAQLAELSGDWTVASKAWVGGPDAIESTATCTNTMTLGGRYLEVDYAGDFMGTRFEGRGVMGYDNGKKQFVSIWYDTFSTGLGLETGQMSEDGKTLTLTGTWETQEGSFPVRHVYEFNGPDAYTLTGYSSMGGAEQKAMELVFTRKAKAVPAAARGNGRCCPKGSKGPGY